MHARTGRKLEPPGSAVHASSKHHDLPDGTYTVCRLSLQAIEDAPIKPPRLQRDSVDLERAIRAWRSRLRV